MRMPCPVEVVPPSVIDGSSVVDPSSVVVSYPDVKSVSFSVEPLFSVVIVASVVEADSSW